MALKVLLADDSVPAQNMGKKILTDAGYDVLTVSNGLEALRKIADTMPDIAILDIFMPGYTGLEICERLRANAATAELPVILTVGKLEPYRPEDGEHVRSNAVIVKPFAAAELTAAVRSLIGVRRAEVVYTAEAPPPVQTADPLQGELVSASDPSAGAPDEPLFSSVSAVDAAPLASENTAARVHAVESLPTSEEPSGPESLLFNPDAVRTPFSASAVEVPPAALDLPAEPGPSAFTEFDLELETPSYYSTETSPAGAATESLHLEPEAAVQDATHSAMDELTASSDTDDIAAEPADATNAELTESGGAAACAEPACIAPAAVEQDSFPLEVPLAPEANILEDGGEDFLTAPDAPLSPEEEARRQAFEDLFNSDVPFPLEEAPIPDPAPAPVSPASSTEISEHELPGIELGPEIVMDDFQDMLVAPALDPEPAKPFEQPAAAVEPIFEGELLLEDVSSSSTPSFEIEQHPVEDYSVLGDSYTVRPDVASNPMAQIHSEVPAEVHEVASMAAPEEAAPVEVAPIENELLAPVASPERSELVAEVAKVEALLVQMQAVRQVDGQAGQTHAGAEYPQSEVAPYLQSFGDAAQAGPGPVQAGEEAQAEAAAGPAQIETELPEAGAALLQHEPEVEPELVSVPLETTPEELAHAREEASVDETAFAAAAADGLNDAERIHKAVELVFDRFRPLLVAAIVRELVRRD